MGNSGSADEDNGLDQHTNDMIKTLSQGTAEEQRVKWQKKLTSEAQFLKYAPDNVKDDDAIVPVAVQRWGPALKYASPRLQDDADTVVAACRTNGTALAYASPRLRDKESVVGEAVKTWGPALKFASPRLRQDKEVIGNAMSSVVSGGADALRCALPPLNEDPQLLQIAGVNGADPIADADKKGLILSERFSIDAEMSPWGAMFVQEFRKEQVRNPRSTLAKFMVYAPNEHAKGFCDKDGYIDQFTATGCSCRGVPRKRGTPNCCAGDELHDRHSGSHFGKSQPKACWRYNYRWHLVQAHHRGGIVLQLKGKGGLGQGQQIEEEIADDVGITVITIEDVNMDHRTGKAQAQVREVILAVERHLEALEKNASN